MEMSKKYMVDLQIWNYNSIWGCFRGGVDGLGDLYWNYIGDCLYTITNQSNAIQTEAHEGISKIPQGNQLELK